MSNQIDCSDDFEVLSPLPISILEANNIPKEFKQHSNWLLWKKEPVMDSKTGKQKVDSTGQKKFTKVPYQANGQKAASTKSNTWANFESIKSAYDSGRFSGIGFTIGDSGLTCIDIDHEDQWKPSELRAIYEGLNNKYYKETSPSGSGYHLWVKAIKPNNMGCKSKHFHNSLVEVYNSDRFITMTGNNPIGTIQECQEEFEQVFKPLIKQAENIIPLPISTLINHDNDTVLDIINYSKQSAKFGDLHYGGGNPTADTSGEDMTYMNILAFYTRGNAQQMDSIYRQSALVRPKWDSKRGDSTYGQITITKAVAECKEFYSPKVEVTFENMDEVAEEKDPFNIKGVDLTTAPGLVGEVIDYINGCSRFPRNHLAVSAALMAISNIGGMRFKDEDQGVTANLFCFNVAGSATGKEAIQQAQNDLMVEAGMGTVSYGTIKSEQEIYRNITRHQATCYTIDEFGITLNKIEQASKGGSASYMGGVIGALMSIYSKANGNLVLGADVIGDLIAELSKQIAVINKLIDNNEAKDYHHTKLASLLVLIESLRKGYIANPFLSVSGYTTPTTFNNLVTYQQATNGFIGRALIFEEKDNNPIRKPSFKKAAMTDTLKAKILTLRNGGKYEISHYDRVEYNDELVPIKTSDEANKLLDDLYFIIYNKAKLAMEKNGLEAVARRSFELVLKVSLVLAMGDGGVRTLEHVKWAYSLVSKDLDNKVRLTTANMAEQENDATIEVLSKVRHKLDNKVGVSIGVLSNKLRRLKKDDIQKALDHLVKNNIAVKEVSRPLRGPETIVYLQK